VTVTGSNFQPGAILRIGGAAASQVTVHSPSQVSAMAPPLPPGTLNDVVFQNPGGGSHTLPDRWFVDFADVPVGHMSYLAAEKVVRGAITSGCGGGNYCPDIPVTRAMAAKFLLRAKHGPLYLPPPAKGTVFLDVPKTDPFAGWIEQLWSEGISGGCGTGKFCGSATLTRGTLAVLLLKSVHGAAYRPPAGTGIFADVPYDDTYAGWIEQLWREGVTSGCGPSTFCPGSLASRGQMALFLVRGFDLP
jgi:hypothetical protein